MWVVLLCQTFDQMLTKRLMQSARELTAATLGQELAASLKFLSNKVEETEGTGKAERAKYQAFATGVKTALRDVWKEPATDVFDIGSVCTIRVPLIHKLIFLLPRSEEEVARIDGVAEKIGTLQGLKNSFNPILNVILLALDAPPVFMRTKALRALGQIVTSDPTILSTAS